MPNTVNIKLLVSTTQLATLLIPNLRNRLNDIDGRSNAHAVLAYFYIEHEVMPALLALYRLPKEEAEKQTAEVSPHA